MSVAPSLLDINVDTLFEQHSVINIAEIHKKLQSDVEKKKEELRTMVGERYRDLLKAADTIGDMQSTAASVSKGINKITATCRSLNDQQLIGFKSTHPQCLVPDRRVQNFYGIAVQIKLLTQLPEMIWTNLDAENFFVATQLFIFSRHISTGLHLDINQPIMRMFPVAKQLWTTLSPFYHTIRRACLATLERQEIDAATAVKCLASLVLLENCTMDKLLGTLIQLRGKAFQRALAADEHDRRVQEKILGSLKVLIDTLDLIHKCFVSGMVQEELGHLTDENAKATIELLDIEDMIILQRLPDIIRKYRPHVMMTELSSASLKQLMTSWLQNTSNDCKRQIQTVIDGIASVKTIHRIKQDAFVIEKPTQWPTILESLYLPTNLDLYNFCYQPLINERVKQIILFAWQETVRQTHQEVVDLANKENISDKDSKSGNKWTPNANDIPLSLKQALSDDKHCHRFLMKSKGYSSGIIAICQSLDGNLKTINDELSLYLDQASGSNESPSEDHSHVVEFLQATSRDSISALITAIKSSKSHSTKSTLICLATLLQAMTELCPSLKLCLSLNSTTKKSSSESWESVCLLLNDESFRFWKEWIDCFVLEYSSMFETTTIDHQIISGELLNWEKITVEENDELDQPIESTIRVPSHVSVTLQKFWHLVCRGLTNILPYTLRRTVTDCLSNELTMYLLRVYKERSEHEFVKASQNASLQFYFDVKFIQTVFVTRDTKSEWEQWQQLAAAFKATVDPFDFELFHKYLTINVKKAVQRMQHKLGILIAHSDHLAAVLATTGQATSAHDKEPNVLTLSTQSVSTGWFSLLPVMSTTPVVHKGATSIEATSKTAKRNSKKPQQPSSQLISATPTAPPNTTPKVTTGGETAAQNLANVKSSAASFFGAMSKDWF